MTTKDEALEKAMRALSDIDQTIDLRRYAFAPPDVTLFDITHEAITACREALAQPAGERGELVQDIHLIQTKMVGSMLFDQTDVAVLSKAAALLSSDAQPSEWVGLTDDEYEELREQHFCWTGDFFRCESTDLASFRSAIEAELREKNARKPAAEKPERWYKAYCDGQRAGAKEERHRCAQVCRDWVKEHAKADGCTYADCDFVAAAEDCATAIENQKDWT